MVNNGNGNQGGQGFGLISAGLLGAVIAFLGLHFLHRHHHHHHHGHHMGHHHGHHPHFMHHHPHFGHMHHHPGGGCGSCGAHRL